MLSEARCPWCGAPAETVRPGHARACAECAARLDWLVEESAAFFAVMGTWMAAASAEDAPAPLSDEDARLWDQMFGDFERGVIEEAQRELTARGGRLDG